MLQYLVILLDDTSVAYCHADNPLKERKLMPLETLKKGILFGMKQNLMIQYVFPDYDLPKEYSEVLESIDNVKIFPINLNYPKNSIFSDSESDVGVANIIPENVKAKNLVLRLKFSELLSKKEEISKLFGQDFRLNICITDADKFSDADIEKYQQLLKDWNEVLLNLYKNEKTPQLNMLTDRMMLDKMHNCDAGVNNIILAANGKFYLCPAFYYDEKTNVFNQLNHHKPSSDNSVGNIENGLNIPNQQLLKLDHAPLCRNCDAYQCRRCLWLNRKLTWDINTPSRQQCVMAHIERNASRNLLNKIRKVGEFMPEINIKEINYLDPFDVRNEF
jgi:CXXX repeat peptide maturase